MWISSRGDILWGQRYQLFVEDAVFMDGSLPVDVMVSLGVIPVKNDTIYASVERSELWKVRRFFACVVVP